jgi:hypothetical protein
VQRAQTELPQASLVIELGRYLVGEAGVYVTRIIDRKVSRGQVFLVTDGGLHHHLAASGNFGQVLRKNYPVTIGTRAASAPRERASVVGPLCTPLDLLADRMDLAVAHEGDLVVVFQSGAYGAERQSAGLPQPSALRRSPGLTERCREVAAGQRDGRLLEHRETHRSSAIAHGDRSDRVVGRRPLTCVAPPALAGRADRRLRGVVIACARFPGLWLLALPAAVPVLNFSPWTGWLIFDEFDLLVLGSVAGGYAGRALGCTEPGASAVPAQSTASPTWIVVVPTILSGLALVGLWRGVAAGGTSFGWFAGYADASNTLRISKSFLYAAALWPLLRSELQRSPGSAIDRFARGMQIGLMLVGFAVLWERIAIPACSTFRHATEPSRRSGKCTSAARPSTSISPWRLRSPPGRW